MTLPSIVEALTQTHYPWPLSPRQSQVLGRLSRCRTPAMGGRIAKCDNCRATDTMYYSCRDRHCPQCQSLAKERWLEDRKSELLPVDYYHVVFTIPHELNSLARANPKTLYNILHKAAWKTIKTLGADQKRLDGKMGMTSFLHTWGQQINHHIHLHCIVPGGAISTDKKQWNRAKSTYLFPVRAMSRVFRGSFVSQLRSAYKEQKLGFHGQSKAYEEKAAFDQLLNVLMGKEWVVYCKPPLPTGKPVLNYLSQYTFKIAISNHRIVSMTQRQVTFRWKDYRDNNKVKTTTLDRCELLRRYLLHVLPAGFMRIRHYGFLGSRYKQKNLDLIRRLLRAAPVIRKVKPAENYIEQMRRVTGKELDQCKVCKQGRMKFVTDIPRFRQLAPD